MAKFRVYGVITGSFLIGTFEADTKEEAIEMAEEKAEPPRLCHYCAGSLDLGDMLEALEAEEV